MLNVIDELKVDPPHLDVPTQEGSERAPSSELHRAAGLVKHIDPGVEIQQLSRELRDLKHREELAERSTSEEWSREHCGQAPGDPPSWDETRPEDPFQP